MSVTQAYLAALRFLTRERGLSIALAIASGAIGIVQMIEPVLFGLVVDALSRGGNAWPAIVTWAVLGLVGILASVLVAVAADRLAHRQRLAAMHAAFERAITLPISYHADRGTGSVIRTIVAGADALFGTWLSVFREQCTAVIAIVVLTPVAFWMEWRLALLLVALATLYAVLNVVAVRRTSGGQANVEHHHMEVSRRVGDALTNVSIVQSYGRLTRETRALRGVMDDLLVAQYPVLTWWAVLTVLTRAASTITMVAIFAVGALLAATGEVTVGEIVSFVGFAGLLIAKLDALTSFVSRVLLQAPTIRSLFELLDAPSPIVDVANAPPLSIPRGEIRYDGVTLRYGDGQQGVFDLDFVVPAGATVALVGPTGAGKTTTVALLQRLRDPDAGQILIDGQPINAVSLASLRHAMAVVFQDSGIFNRSIAENIGIGRPDASEDDIAAAAAQAEASEFIATKPNGMAFVVGERGAALSGGERQRVAIARAILKDAPILILDEATSALDTATEATIKRALDRVRAGRTTIVIAHRLSTVADADVILVMDRGRIVERGQFDDLVSQGGLFARLVAEGSLIKPRETD
ncbi:MAG: glucan ABC transporter ATP-binding protein/ permease [Pseudomonadota bacterium]